MSCDFFGLCIRATQVTVPARWIVVSLAFGGCATTPFGVDFFSDGDVREHCLPDTTESESEQFQGYEIREFLADFGSGEGLTQDDDREAVSVTFEPIGAGRVTTLNEGADLRCDAFFPTLAVDGRWTVQVEGRFAIGWEGAATSTAEANSLSGSIHSPDIVLPGTAQTPDEPGEEHGLVRTTLISESDGRVSATGAAERTWVDGEHSEALLEEVAVW